MNTKRANKSSKKHDFFNRAKSLANLREVFRSSQVTSLLAEALAIGYRLEAEVFQATYGDSIGREYWKTQLSEPILAYQLAYVLSVHVAENVDQQESAKIATILAFRDAAEAGEEWFIGDTAPLIAVENGQRSFESLGKVKVCPRAAVKWLLNKPKRQHLVPSTLRSFLQFDGVSGRQRRVTERTAARFVDDFINNEQGQGRRPSMEGLEAAAKDAGIRGGRELLRAAFNLCMGGRRGRPAKAPPKTAKNKLPQFCTFRS